MSNMTKKWRHFGVCLLYCSAVSQTQWLLWTLTGSETQHSESACGTCVHECVWIVQELCESRGGHPRLSVLMSLLVSVDVKNYWTMFRHWSQLVPQLTSEDIKHQLIIWVCVYIYMCTYACVCACVLDSTTNSDSVCSDNRSSILKSTPTKYWKTYTKSLYLCRSSLMQGS